MFTFWGKYKHATTWLRLLVNSVLIHKKAHTIIFVRHVGYILWRIFLWLESKNNAFSHCFYCWNGPVAEKIRYEWMGCLLCNWKHSLINDFVQAGVRISSPCWGGGFCIISWFALILIPCERQACQVAVNSHCLMWGNHFSRGLLIGNKMLSCARWMWSFSVLQQKSFRSPRGTAVAFTSVSTLCVIVKTFSSNM